MFFNMKKNMYLIMSLFCMLLHSCSTYQKEYLKDDSGIMVENMKNNTDSERYNHDNQIYIPGTKYIYNFTYTKGKKEFYMKGVPDTEEWSLIPFKEKSGKINKIYLDVRSGLSPFIEKIPDYNQTVIKYDYLLENGKVWNNEMTGIIENKKNIWIHPPRMGLFQILEMAPFPFINWDTLKKNKPWTWSLTYGSHYANPLWMTWQGNINSKTTYIPNGIKKIQTPLGDLACYEINSTSHSRLGNTQLKFFFNETYGFVRLEYVNIDQSKIILNLEKVDK